MAFHPGNIKNPFMSQVVLWLFFLPLLSLIFLPMMHLNNDIQPAELKMIEKSGVKINEVNDKTDEQFTRWFITSGAISASMKLFSGDSDLSSYGASALSSNASSFAYAWIKSVWGMVYKCLWRLHALFWVYVAAICTVGIPCLWDGLFVRARKRYQFESHNPLVFNMSTHIAVLVIGLLIYIPMIPFSLTPEIMAMFMGFLGLSLWWAASNFQTGV